MVGLRVITEVLIVFVICIFFIFYKENVMLSFYLLSGIMFIKKLKEFLIFL